MKQFGKILKFELKNYFTNKVFVGITLFLMIVIAFAMFFPQISSFLDSDTDIRYPEENNGEQAPNGSVDSLPVMLIYGKEAQNVKDVFSEAFSEYNVQVAEGEEKTLKVTAKDGYEIKSITIDGKEQKIKDATNFEKDITFDADVEIEIEFAAVGTTEMVKGWACLSSLNGAAPMGITLLAGAVAMLFIKKKRNND